MEAVVLISMTALVASLFALLVAIGSALRLQNAERASGVDVGLPPGSRVDHEALSAFVGRSNADAFVRGPTLVVVAKRTCPGCQDLVVRMNRLSRELGHLRVLMIERGRGEDATLRTLAEFEAVWVIDSVDRSKQVFRTNISPHAFLIEHGKVLRQMSGTHAVDHLLEQGLANPSTAPVATPL